MFLLGKRSCKQVRPGPTLARLLVANGAVNIRTMMFCWFYIWSDVASNIYKYLTILESVRPLAA